MPKGFSKTPRLTAKRKSVAQRRLWRDKDVRAKRLAGLRRATRTPEFRAKMSIIVTPRMNQPATRKRSSLALKRRHRDLVYHARALEGLRKGRDKRSREGFTEEHRHNMSLATKGKKKPPRSKAYRAKIGQNSKRRWAEFKASGHAKVVAAKISKSVKHLIASDPAYRKVVLEASLKGMRVAGMLRPNKTELKLEAILNKNFPGEFKMNVHGEVSIAGKIPDFVNCNGRKCLVEYFGNMWHPPEDVPARKLCFQKYGFETAIICGDEIRNEDLVVSKVAESMELCDKKGKK